MKWILLGLTWSIITVWYKRRQREKEESLYQQQEEQEHLETEYYEHWDQYT